MIEFKDVSVTYDNRNNIETQALNHAELKIEQGEFVFIVGKSGAGKSTLTKLVIAEVAPTEGDVIIDNIHVNNLTRKQIPYFRRKIGMVFQDFRLLPNKTVYENVAFALEIVGASPKQIRRKVPEALSRVDLGDRAKSYPDQLSGGEQQRVAIARAIVNKPSIIIADEPTGNLDPQISGEILKMLLDINREGTTVVVVTHDMNLVKTVSKRVIRLSDGRIVSDTVGGVDLEATYN
ncbi:MAG: cell division ATP-binding protein FtsE [Ruminococcaceae bacterium]|nr:cell division ATP-binding protein FtsE [Oscillospiraceae bacterium]